ncbi:MAG: hypothetical protein HYY01_01365 [Chloroflexi bacterium]|nr:hypothetical protein [Chloroflexota bacterium]
MPHYNFERECRTPNSEAYIVLQGEHPVGKVDLHFTSSVVHATLCVSSDLNEEDIKGLIEIIDEEIVNTADVARDDFIVNVYQGQDMGVYSDINFEAEGNGTDKPEEW